MHRALPLFFVALFLVAVILPTANLAQSAAKTAVRANAPYKNPRLPAEKRVADLLKRMTLEEKASMLAGSGWMESMPIPRLGIPAIKMADGPLGVRSWAGSSQSPAFPARR